MRFALLQFSINPDPNKNYQKIENAILQAKENNADVLVTQECALSGYPPIEIESVEEINFEKQEKELQKITALAKENEINVLLGLIRKADDQIKNSVAILSPSGTIDYYDKRALWGWDLDNYSPGTISNGIVIINGIKIGIRICFEIRFPEYFRELYKENVDIAIIQSNDVSKEPNPNRIEIMKSHLVTRAIENIFTVISVNSTTFHQGTPTCVINTEGKILTEAKLNNESITYYDYVKPEPGFGAKGRIHYSDKLAGV
jgi:omega-amidase